MGRSGTLVDRTRALRGASCSMRAAGTIGISGSCTSQIQLKAFSANVDSGTVIGAR